MKLTAIGETQIVDFSEVVRWTAREIRRLYPDAKVDIEDIERTVAELVDITLTIQMNWTKVRRYRPEEDYLNMLGLDNVNQGWMFIQDVQNEVKALLRTFLNLPTWHVVSMRVRDTYAHIELGDDFRVKDWMEKHAKDYDVRDTKLRW